MWGGEREWKDLEYFMRPPQQQEPIDRIVENSHQARGELRKLYDKGVPLNFKVLVNDKTYYGRIVGWALDYPHIHIRELNQAFEFSWMALWRAWKDKKVLKV